MAAAREVGRVSVRVVPDTDGFRRDLKRQLESIVKGVEAKINVNPDVSGFRQKVNASVKGMRTEVAVVPDVKTFRGHIKEMFANAGGRSFSGIGPFADTLALVAAVAAVAAPALALVSGALIAMPAAITAALMPIGVLALGMNGIKKAAESLVAPLESLKKTLSGTFETRLTPVFKQLATIFPSLEKSMPTVANGLSDMAKAFVDTVTSGPGMEKINNTIRNIGNALTLASPGIASFTDGMLGMVERVSQKFPAVSEWFNQVGQSFSNWVSKASSNGQLDTAMSNFGKTIKEVLGLVGDLASKGFEFLSDPEFGAKMEKFVQNARKLTDEVLPTLKTVFEDISDALDDLVTVIQKVNDAFKQPTPEEAKKQSQDRLTKPTGESTLPAWADPQGWGIALRQKLGEIWGQVRTQVANVITEIVGKFAQVPSALGSAWSSIVGIAQSAWNGVVQAVTSAVSGVVNTVISVGGQILTEVGSWPGKIQSFFSDAINWLVDAGRNVVQGLINGISGMIDSAVAKAKELASSVKDAVTGFLGIHSPSTVMADIGGFIGDGLINGMKSKQSEIEKTAQGIGQSIKDAFDWSDYEQRGIDAGFAFAGANADQFMSDLGISGKGLLSQLGEQGLKFGMDFAGKALTQNFYTSNVDDTIAVKNNQLNKQALGVVGKSG
ncbi:Phage-related protein [Mycobacteroides abscessus subsp. bolletii]|uniref:phage tail protein n=2 Tax=Mycobacteroides abscessus TaxID=36809 RepID=UPI0009D52762|nr:cation transporter [Mycobacteroides abscessus]SLF41026.1 Phage-related protein [Mycobacteroides abscessus subsp. bolletii]